MLRRDARPMAEKPRIFTKNFVLLFLINLLISIAYFMLFTTMARYAILAFSCTDTVAGLVSSIFMISSVTARVICGRYATSVGLKRSTICAGVLMLVSCALYFVCSANLALLIVVRVLHGFSFGIANTTVPALVTELLPREQAGTGTGYFMLSNTLGSAIGPWIGLSLANSLSYTVMFVLCTATALVSLVSALLLTVDVRIERGGGAASSDGKPGHSRFGAVLSSFFDPAVFLLSIFMFLVAVAYSGMNSFLNSFTVLIGLQDVAPFVFVLYAVTLLVSRPVAGKIMDRSGENLVLVPSILLMAVGLVILANVNGPVSLLVVGPLIAIGFGNSMSTGLGIIARDGAKGSKTLGVSTFYFLCDLGVGVGPILLGCAVSALGYRPMYLLCAGLAVCAAVYYYLQHGRKQHGL